MVNLTRDIMKVKMKRFNIHHKLNLANEPIEDFLGGLKTIRVEVSKEEFLNKYIPCLKKLFNDNIIQDTDELESLLLEFFLMDTDLCEVHNLPLIYNDTYIFFTYIRNNEDNDIKTLLTTEDGDSCRFYEYIVNYSCGRFELGINAWDRVGTSVFRIEDNPLYIKMEEVKKHLEEFGRWENNQIHILMNVNCDRLGTSINNGFIWDKPVFIDDVMSPLSHHDKIFDIDNFKDGESCMILINHVIFESMEINPPISDNGVELSITPRTDFFKGDDGVIRVDSNKILIPTNIPRKEIFVWSNAMYKNLVLNIDSNIDEWYNKKCNVYKHLIHYNQMNALRNVTFIVNDELNYKVMLYVVE